MKIAFLMPSYVWTPSGGMRVVYEYASRLAARGHDVTVVHPRRLNRPGPPQKLSAYTLARVTALRMRNLLMKPSVDWQPIDSRVRMLYVPGPDSRHIPDGNAIFATAWQTAPYVLNYPDSKGEKFYLIQHYETWMGPKDLVDATWRFPLHKVVISKWLVEVGKQLGCEDLAYIPNAINPKIHRLTQPIEGRNARVAMAFSKEAFKGAADGIEALTITREKYPNLKVVCFGQTNVRPSIPQWIEYHSNPPQDYIVQEIYNKSSIFLCPSWSEGFALPPAEAASCGCAVVATDNGGIRDYIENGVNGLLSAPRDPKALAANLCLLLGDENRRVRLAKACNDSVGRLSWHRSADQLQEFISKIVDEERCDPGARKLVKADSI